jgi:hypothetical protein
MEVGQKVRVYRLRDRAPQDVIKRLGQVGEIRDFRMTDGSGVGAFVRFDDQYTTWFFEDELQVVS